MPDLGLVLVDGELSSVLVVVVAIWYLAAVPVAAVGPGYHDSADTLTGHFPLQFGKDQDNPQHRFADCRRGIELLVLGDKGDAQRLELLVHGREVQKVAADPVDFPDQDVRELPVTDTGDHLVGRPYPSGTEWTPGCR